MPCCTLGNSASGMMLDMEGVKVPVGDGEVGERDPERSLEENSISSYSRERISGDTIQDSSSFAVIDRKVQKSLVVQAV